MGGTSGWRGRALAPPGSVVSKAVEAGPEAQSRPGLGAAAGCHFVDAESTVSVGGGRVVSRPKLWFLERWEELEELVLFLLRVWWPDGFW